jgi:hypothetical protein
MPEQIIRLLKAKQFTIILEKQIKSFFCQESDYQTDVVSNLLSVLARPGFRPAGSFLRVRINNG